MTNMTPGISGMSVYVPPSRVDLEAWCGWTEQSWPKVQATVGSSYRLPAPDEATFQDVGVEYYEYLPEISLTPPVHARLEEQRA